MAAVGQVEVPVLWGELLLPLPPLYLSLGLETSALRVSSETGFHEKPALALQRFVACSPPTRAVQ